MARLLDQAPHEDLARLRWVWFASEPMPASLLERWWDALPGVATHQFYGMTECVPVTVASDRLQREEPTTVGVPFPTTRAVGPTSTASSSAAARPRCSATTAAAARSRPTAPSAPATSAGSTSAAGSSSPGA